MSFRIALEPNRRAATRFIGKVRRGLQAIFVDNPDITRSRVAESIGVHRSVITKQLNGRADMSLGRVAEIAWAAGYRPVVTFEKATRQEGCNRNLPDAPVYGTEFSSRYHSGNEAAVVQPIPATQERTRILVDAV